MKRQNVIFLFLGTGFVFLLAVFFSTRPVLAVTVDNWEEAFEVFEDRYHLNQESMQDQGENFNVSSQKGQAPQVMVYFSPTDPKPGSQIEARAFPEFFSNSTDALYYTWYLKRKECDLKDDDLSDKEKRLCDFNNDDKITLEDWKIVAMQNIAAKNFDSTCALDDNLSDEERAECAENMYDPDSSSRINPEGDKGRDKDEDGYVAIFGGDTKENQNSYCYLHDFDDGYNYELPSCFHLFPDNYAIDLDTGEIERAGDIGTNGESGFPIEEEHFWRTDPEDPSTAKNGVKDEANLAGLGQDTFKWIYAPEDKVGVVVEGTSMYNTKYDDSSMMVMWAFPQNTCEIQGPGEKTESIKGYDVKIKTATNTESDVTKCLEDNLIDPTEGDQAENIDLSLSFSPEDPAAKLLPWKEWEAVCVGKTEEACKEEQKKMSADMAETADTLAINASSSNATEGSQRTVYTWRVFASRDGSYNTRFDSENDWVNITRDLTDAKSVSRTSGNSVTSLFLNLNLNKEGFQSDKYNQWIPGFEEYFNEETDTAYFRITVNATENFRGRVTESGSAETVVKISINKKIDVYYVVGVKNENTGMMSVKRRLEPEPLLLCTGKEYPEQLTICPVLKNQIIGIKLEAEGEYRDFLWTLNGVPLICSKDVSEECDDTKQGAVNFFPVSGETGDLSTLSVTASRAGGNDFDEAGKSFTVSRRFQIVDPDFDIVSDDQSIAWRKYLGKYRNMDGTESEDYSKTSFEGIPGGIAKFSALFRPDALGTFVLNGIKAGDDQNEMIWSKNGKPFNWNDASALIGLDGNVGDIYTVTLAGAYNQSRELRKALYDIWRISPFSSETVRFSKEIQIQLVTAGESPYAKRKSNAFFASLISAVPPIVLFSVRLILSMGLILLIVSVVFSVMPEERREGSR